MKTIALSAALCCYFAQATASLPENDTIMAHTYDTGKSSWEQPNPIFRWPLPKIMGEASISITFISLENEKRESISAEAISGAEKFISSILNPHGIHATFTRKTSSVIKTDALVHQWKSTLPAVPGQLVIYVFPESNEQMRSAYYVTNEIVAERVVVPYSNDQEFQVFAAKNLCHMLGLLPTYFESPFLQVSAENGKDCGMAGDFVCDTEFDYLGLKNEVRKKSCKYKGHIGNPDPSNILSNSWTECMDHITPEQANKIKYNLSVIPLLQRRLNEKSTIPLNIDIATSFPAAEEASLK